MMLLRPALYVLVAISVAGCCEDQPDEPKPLGTGSLRVDVVLEEVRTQFDVGGTWKPFWTKPEDPGAPPTFPGLHSPLDVIRLAEQVALPDFLVSPTLTSTNVADLIRKTFDELAAEVAAPYSLGEWILTGGGGTWTRPPPPPPDPLIAFQVKQSGSTTAYERKYEPGTDKDGPASGTASYWVLFSFHEAAE